MRLAISTILFGIIRCNQFDSLIHDAQDMFSKSWIEQLKTDIQNQAGFELSASYPFVAAIESPVVQQGASDGEVGLKKYKSDRLCFGGDEIIGGLVGNIDPKTDTCHVMSDILYKSDTKYERHDIRAIVFKDKSIKCKKTNNEPCSLSFKLSMTGNQSAIVLSDGSVMSGSQIIIDSPETALIIDETSRMNVDGSSFSDKGTVNGQGASFVGQGGFCSTTGQEPEDKRYSRFNERPLDENPYNLLKDDLVGSKGMTGTSNGQKTAGGGYIFLNLDQLILSGTGEKITADGLPKWDSDIKMTLHGGSGGYIFIKTQNKYGENEIGSKTLIQARGGLGKLDGFAGAGGIILFAGNFTQGFFNVNTQGGVADMNEEISDKECANGAAGTIYWEQPDQLLVDNQQVPTDKKTKIVAARVTNKSDEYFGENVIARSIYAFNGAVLEVRNQYITNILFPTLVMHDQTTMIVKIFRVQTLEVRYRHNFAVSKETTLDFTGIPGRVSFKSISPENEKHLTMINLGRTIFSYHLMLEANTLLIQGETVDPTIREHRDQHKVVNSENTIELYASDIQVMKHGTLEAAKIMMFAHKDITIMEGSKIESLIDHECTTSKRDIRLYQCMEHTTEATFDLPNINYEYVVEYFNRQYGYKRNSRKWMGTIEEMRPEINNKWNVYMMALGKLEVQDTRINGPRVGMCSNEIYLVKSQIDATAKGCRAGQGLGAGSRTSGCAASGASHGGVGGHGGAEADSKNKNPVHCEANYPSPYYFGDEARYEGSGGGSGDKDGLTGGAGGGIVWLTTPGKITLKQSQIHADGSFGKVETHTQHGSGGGSGGSIQLIALQMAGDGRVSAKGGNGSPNGGGGGSGGRLAMKYLKSYLASSYPDQSINWSGDHDLQGGRADGLTFQTLTPLYGQEGTKWHSKCYPGYSGVFCEPCGIGEFKYDYSYGTCLPCRNKPKNSYYDKSAEPSSMCSYQCSSYLEHEKTNPDCLDPAQLEIQRMGGVIPFFLLLAFFLIISMSIFVLLSCKSAQIAENLKDLPETLYEAWDSETEYVEKRKLNERNFQIRDCEIWSHTHRMYLLGNNSIKYPWQIPKDFPYHALKKDDREKLVEFIDYQNEKLKFSSMAKWTFFFVNLLYLPIARGFHGDMRKHKFRGLQQELFRLYPHAFWNKNDSQDNKTMRLGCSADHQLAFIDFIDFSKTKETWVGVKLPMQLLLSGSGTFNHPYRLDFETDSLIKSVSMIKFDFFKDKLPIFLENFNSQLNKLSFFKMEVQVMRDLQKTVRWLEKANACMFHHFGVKAVLYITENQYTEIDTGVFKQKRRSFPLETVFFDGFPEMFYTLLRYVRDKLISGKSEIRLCIVFKKHTKLKQILTQNRINALNEESQKFSKQYSTNKTSYQMAIDKQESVLFDETDRQTEEERVTVADRSSSRSQYLPPSGINDTVGSISSTQSNDQTLVQPVKLVDKSRRAFSLSIDSSKAFELALRKPRNKWKHKVTRCRGDIYGMYLLFMKHQGSPPGMKDLNWIFTLYSALLALDIMMLINFTMHIFTPQENFKLFGWAFMFVFFAIPFLSPAFAIFSAITGSDTALKMTNNMNSLMICFNIPITMLLSMYNQDDPVYLLLLALIISVKIGLSALGAKVRMFLINPRYSKNKFKLMKILHRQNKKMQIREKVLGKEAVMQLDGIGSSNSSISTGLLESALDTQKMRDKLVEDI